MVASTSGVSGSSTTGTSGSDAAAAAAAAEAARRRAEAARRAAEAARKAAEAAARAAAAARQAAIAARQAAQVAKQQAADKTKTPAEQKTAGEAAKVAHQKAVGATKVAQQKAQERQKAEEQVALTAKRAATEMTKANEIARREKVAPPFTEKDIKATAPKKNELASAFEGSRRKAGLEKLLGVQAPTTAQTQQRLNGDKQFDLLNSNPENHAALRQLGIRNGQGLIHLGERLEAQATRGEGPRANDVALKDVSDKAALGRIISAAGETRTDEAVKKTLKDPRFAAQVGEGKTAQEAAKSSGQLRNELLGNIPLIGDQLNNSAAGSQGKAKGEQLANEVIERATRGVGGDLSKATPQELNKALTRAMRETEGVQSLMKDDALTGAGLNRDDQRGLASAYGKGLGEGLRETLTEALGNDAGKVLGGQAGQELERLTESAGKKIGEKSFGPEVGREVATAGKEASKFVQKDFNAEQASEAATRLEQAAGVSPQEGAKVLREELKNLPKGARRDFLEQSKESLNAMGQGLNGLSSSDATLVRKEIDKAAEAMGKRGPEMLKEVAKGRIEGAMELGPEEGAAALSEELKTLPDSMKRDFVTEMTPTLKALGGAIDEGLDGNESIDATAIRASLDQATKAAGPAGGELALQVAQGRIERAVKYSKPDAAAALEEEIRNIPNVAARAVLLDRLAPQIEEISEAAVGEIDDEAPRQDIIRSFSDIAELSGRAGTEILAKEFADAQQDGDETHTDVDDGNQLGGAFREVLYSPDKNGNNSHQYNPAFGLALAQELHDRGGVGDAAADVAQGVHEGMNNEDPGWAERAIGDVGNFLKDVGETALDGLDAAANAAIDVAEAGLRFASDAFDFVTQPLTDAINGQVEKLGPGDSYKVAIGGGASVGAVGVSGEAYLEVTRGEDGGYTVALGGEIDADVAKKLKLPVTLGTDGRVEFAFDSLEDAKRGAGTLAQIGGAAVAGGVVAGGAAAVANIGDGDLGFLADNVSAVEVGATAAADLSAKLGLPGMDPATGTGVGLSASADVRARIEFGEGDAPPSVTFTNTLSGEMSAGLGASVPGGPGISLSGSASAEFQVQHKLTLPEDFGFDDVDNLGEVAKNSTIESSVQVQLSQSGSVNGNVGPFQGGASGTLTETLTISGNPADIIAQGAPKLLKGDVPGAVKALGDHVDVNASVEFVGTGTAGGGLTAGALAPGQGGGSTSISTGVQKGEQIEARFKISGDPIAIAKDGIPKILQGDIPGAAKAIGDNVNVEAEITTGSTTTTGADINIDAVVVEAHFSAERTDVEEETVFQYGVDDPNTTRSETRTGTQAARDLQQLWGRVA